MFAWYPNILSHLPGILIILDCATFYHNILLHFAHLPDIYTLWSAQHARLLAFLILLQICLMLNLPPPSTEGCCPLPLFSPAPPPWPQKNWTPHCKKVQFGSHYDHCIHQSRRCSDKPEVCDPHPLVRALPGGQNAEVWHKVVLVLMRTVHCFDRRDFLSASSFTIIPPASPHSA